MVYALIIQFALNTKPVVIRYSDPTVCWEAAVDAKKNGKGVQDAFCIKVQ